MKNKSKIERYIIEEIEFAYENRPLPDNRFFIKVIRHANISIEVTIENFEFCAIVMRDDGTVFPRISEYLESKVLSEIKM